MSMECVYVMGDALSSLRGLLMSTSLGVAVCPRIGPDLRLQPHKRLFRAQKRPTRPELQAMRNSYTVIGHF
jgi:hypothetical protein